MYQDLSNNKKVTSKMAGPRAKNEQPRGAKNGTGNKSCRKKKKKKKPREWRLDKVQNGCKQMEDKRNGEWKK